MDCCAFCNAAAYKIKNLKEVFQNKYKTTLYRDVAHVEIPVDDIICDVFYFPYGSVVSWGVPKEKGIKFLELARDFATQPSEDTETDEFTYIQGDTNKIVDDEIILTSLDTLTKLAVSHGIAQSVKLGTFEFALQKTFTQTRKIPEDLATYGRISLSRREIRKKMGELFIERNSINLHLDVLDQPEFFWDYPELEPLYIMTANYLELTTRVEVLNQRLGIVHELFEMLGNELNHQHSSRLEWTIICLIVIEVTLSLLRDVLKII
jgi:uncharacterized Rmd1/YagE family protein